MGVKELVKRLEDNKLKIATAESCTGGLLAKKITDISGASNVCELGVVTYTNRIKNEFLEIPNEVLDTVGAVSSECAILLATNVSKLAKSDIGVGITGFAGPTGDKVGLVYVSIYLKSEDKAYVKGLMIDGDRDGIREVATEEAVEMVLELLKI